MHRGLLVLGVEVAELRVLQQRLAYARDAAVAEDAQAAGKERLALSVALDVLVNEKLDEGLRRGESFGLHVVFLLKILRVLQ